MNNYDENEEIKKYTGIVIKIARSFKPKGYNELQDYIQEGNIALLRAIRKHDINKGKISTVAWKYITNAIIRYCNKQNKYRDKQRNIEKVSTVDINIWEYLPDSLSNIEQLVTIMRYNGYTFQEIGNKLGFTKSWTRHIFNNTLEKIQKANE